MNLIDYRASRIAAFAVGAFILLAATLLSQSLWDAIARATLLAVVAFAMMFAPKRLGVLSWSAGVPAFYGLFFLLLPLPQTLYGNNPLESDHGTANALLIAASGLFAFFVGAMTVHLTKKPPSTFAPQPSRRNRRAVPNGSFHERLATKRCFTSKFDSDLSLRRL